MRRLCCCCCKSWRLGQMDVERFYIGDDDSDPLSRLPDRSDGHAVPVAGSVQDRSLDVPIANIAVPLDPIAIRTLGSSGHEEFADDAKCRFVNVDDSLQASDTASKFESKIDRIETTLMDFMAKLDFLTSARSPGEAFLGECERRPEPMSAHEMS